MSAIAQDRRHLLVWHSRILRLIFVLASISGFLVDEVTAAIASARVAPNDQSESPQARGDV